MTRIVLLVLVGLLALVAPGVAAGDDPEPDPGPTAATVLPDASVFGAGWVQADVISPDSIERYGFTMSPDVFREGAAGIYYGPQGARVLVVNFLLTDSRVAIRTSWESATDLMNSATWSMHSDYSRDRQLETMTPPQGCLEAKRAEGTERTFRLPVGATLCAADDESLLLVIVYGTVNELTGTAAADAIVTQIVAP